MSEPELAAREWTYLGVRVDSSRKARHAWLNHLGGFGSFDTGPDGGVAAVGGVFEVECSEDAKLARIKSARYVRTSEDERLAEWALQHRAAQAEDEANKAAKRLVKDTTGQLGGLTLEQVREQWLNSTQMGKIGIQTAVLQYLTAVRR